MNKLISIAKRRCINYRVKLLEMSQRVSAIHLGGTFSSTEILDAIYNILRKKMREKTLYYKRSLLSTPVCYSKRFESFKWKRFKIL